MSRMTKSHDSTRRKHRNINLQNESHQDSNMQGGASIDNSFPSANYKANIVGDDGITNIQVSS